MHPSAEFISEWFAGTTGRVYLCSLPNPELKGTPAGEPDERHILTRSTEQISGFVGKWDRPGRGLYFCTATIQPDATRRAKETLAELVALHADIDFKSVVETPEEIERIVGQLSPPPTRVHHSGHGLQLFWRFATPIPATTESIAGHERLLRLLANHVGGDLACCEAARLMRLPGTVNSKGGEEIPVRIVTIRLDACYGSRLLH
jgi:RepB DNA-primase from phage plasmid